MDRRYYLLKVAIVLLAIVTVAVTSGMGSTEIAHAANHARYSAPFAIEAAAWQATAYVAHTTASLINSAACMIGL